MVAKSASKAFSLTRRRIIETGASTFLLAGAAPTIVPSRARAQAKTLKILQWKHFVPGYDEWFHTYVDEWGRANDTQVIVDKVGFGDINGLAHAEVSAGRGHDMISFVTPPAIFHDQAVDHQDVYAEAEQRYGVVADFIKKSTYHPATRKHFGFCASYAPALITYRADLWDEVSMAPDSWQDVRAGGRRVKLLHSRPVGFSLAPEQNSGHTMRAIMYSFGASEQDEEGRPALKSEATLEAIRYVRALYEEAMIDDVLVWDGASNNLFMLNDEGSLTLDTLSIARASESKNLPVATALRLASPPTGPAGRLAPSFGFYTYIIWKFAENIAGAKRFLVDYVANSRAAFAASGFQNYPSFPGAVPDLGGLVARDAAVTPADKYGVLTEAASWTTNVGHPGYTSPAISEVYDRGLIPDMFAKAATGQLTPEEAMDAADLEVRRIFEKHGRA